MGGNRYFPAISCQDVKDKIPIEDNFYEIEKQLSLALIVAGMQETRE